MTDIADLTLDELRPLIAAALPADAAFDGWGDKALAATAERLGVDPAVARFAFKDGAMDMIASWFASVDARMIAALPADALAVMKVRERITALIETRLALLALDREALRRAQAVMALPAHAPAALRLGWRTADTMWRAAGDTATDYNHYSKRAILGSVYAATMLVFVNDESEDWVETRAFLARRIEGVMRFEKAKAQWTAIKPPFSMARFLGRLRYPG
jgi:ubiquinone biosynthesis protein COQ9